MAMTRGQFTKLVLPGLHEAFFMKWDEKSQAHPSVFNMLTSDRKQEEDVGFGGFTTVPAKAEGTAITYENALQGYSKTYTHTSYGKGFRITREMRDDDLYGVMRRMSEAMGRAARYTVESTASNIFNNGFTDKGPDASTLFATAHALKGGGTYANRPSTDADLSVASLQAGLTSFRKQVDEQNLLLDIQPRVLLVPPDLEFVAYEITKSAQKPYTADNEINAVQGRLEVAIWDHLTDTDAWFILGAKDDHMLRFFWRTKVETADDGDFDTDDVKFKCFMRFSVGYSDWRGTYGTTGA